MSTFNWILVFETRFPRWSLELVYYFLSMTVWGEIYIILHRRLINNNAIYLTNKPIKNSCYTTDILPLDTSRDLLTTQRANLKTKSVDFTDNKNVQRERRGCDNMSKQQIHLETGTSWIQILAKSQKWFTVKLIIRGMTAMPQFRILGLEHPYITNKLEKDVKSNQSNSIL